MSKYIPRIMDSIIESRLKDFGAVNLEGCKWCGKSTTAKQFAKSFVELQNVGENQEALFLAINQPSIILEGEKPRLIDEWQDAPQIWDAVRYDVDKTQLTGQYILTGSSTPRQNKPRHSGAGRFANLKMRPMSLFESGDSNGDVSLGDLFDGKEEIHGTSSLDFRNIAHLCTRGGWPISVVRETSDPFILVREYLNIIIERGEGFSNIEYYSPEKMRALLRSLARNISSPIKGTTLMADIEANTGVSISDTTLANYLAVLEQCHILDDIEAWSPKLRSKTQIRNSRKRNFVDPSLAVASLFGTENDLIIDLRSFGLIFESLVLRDLKVYSGALNGDLYYYRDQNGAECDAVIHLPGGKWAGIEVKLGADQKSVSDGVKSLLRFESVVDTGAMKPPAFLMVITGVGKFAYRNEDGVFVVPVGCLRP